MCNPWHTDTCVYVWSVITSHSCKGLGGYQSDFKMSSWTYCEQAELHDNWGFLQNCIYLWTKLIKMCVIKQIINHYFVFFFSFSLSDAVELLILWLTSKAGKTSLILSLPRHPFRGPSSLLERKFLHYWKKKNRHTNKHTNKHTKTDIHVKWTQNVKWYDYV